MKLGYHIKFRKDIITSIKDEFKNKPIKYVQLMLNNKLILPKINIDETKEYLKNNNITLFFHSPYSLNLSKKSSINYLIKELELSHNIGAFGSIIHLKGGDENEFKQSIKYILKNTTSNLVLETSSKKYELFNNIYKLKKFYKSFSKTERKKLSLCIDTCHIWDCGYEPTNKVFDLLGKYTSVVQFNNSKNKMNMHKDRHENIFEGKISSTKLLKFIKLFDVPIILETPNASKDYNKLKSKIKQK